MLISVLLSIGGLITVIIVSIVISVVSSLKEDKKKNSLFGQFVRHSRPNKPVSSTPAEDDHSSYASDNGMAGHMDGEDYDSAISSAASFINNSPEVAPSNPLGDVISSVAQQQRTKRATEEGKKMETVIDDTPESEYSLRDPEAAKQAIIYSEILRPKF